MTWFLDCVGIGVLLASVGFVLRELGFRGAPLVGALGLTLMLLVIMSPLAELLSSLTEVVSLAGISSLAASLARVVGVGYISAASSAISRQLGEEGIARALELVGRIEILALSVPYVVSVVELVAEELL